MYRMEIKDKGFLCGDLDIQEIFSNPANARKQVYPAEFAPLDSPHALRNVFVKEMHSSCGNTLTFLAPCLRPNCDLSRELEILAELKKLNQETQARIAPYFPSPIAVIRDSWASYKIISEHGGQDLSRYLYARCKRDQMLPHFSNYRRTVLVSQLYAAEDFLFQHNIVHCGLSPEHILYDPGAEQIKICGFTRNQRVNADGRLYFDRLLSEQKYEEDEMPPEYACRHHDGNDAGGRLVSVEASSFLVYIFCKTVLEAFILNGISYSDTSDSNIGMLRAFFPHYKTRPSCCAIGPTFPLVEHTDFKLVSLGVIIIIISEHIYSILLFRSRIEMKNMLVCGLELEPLDRVLWSSIKKSLEQYAELELRFLAEGHVEEFAPPLASI